MTELFFNLQLEASSYEDVIQTLSKSMLEQQCVNEIYVEEVLKREKKLPTGLKTGHINVAIPHTDPSHVLKSALSVATLEEPVKFRLMENPEECIDVEIVFLIAMADPKEQIHLLPKLMSVFKNKDLLTKIKEARSESDLEEIVSKTLL